MTNGSNTIGVVLTGMGDDGTRGSQIIKQAGGIVIAQDKDTSPIFGMPACVVKAVEVDKVLPIDKIGKEITRLCNIKSSPIKR